MMKKGLRRREILLCVRGVGLNIFPDEEGIKTGVFVGVFGGVA